MCVCVPVAAMLVVTSGVRAEGELRFHVRDDGGALPAAAKSR